MPAGNLYWSRLAAGLHLSGADGATTLADAKGHAFYRSGAVAVSTEQSRFAGLGSAYFPGGTNDLIKCDAHADFGASAPSMAIAFSMHPMAYPVGQEIRLIMIGTNGSSGTCFVALTPSGVIYFGIAAGGTNATATAAGSFPLNAWTDVLFTMFRREALLYVNGALQAHRLNQNAPDGSFPKRVQIGGDNSGFPSVDGRFKGYLAELQIGLADGLVPDRWPPSAPFAEFQGVAAVTPAGRHAAMFQTPAQAVRARRQSIATLAQDLVNTGDGIVAGTTKNVGTPNYPVSRRVRMFRKRDGVLIREVWSDTSGNYAFAKVRRGVPYVVESSDHTGVYNAVVADAILAEAMP